MFRYTSGRSELEGRKPRDLADLTELRNFSPTFEKSIPPPSPSTFPMDPSGDKRSEPKNKNLEISKPSGVRLRLEWFKASGMRANGVLGCIEIINQFGTPFLCSADRWWWNRVYTSKFILTVYVCGLIDLDFVIPVFHVIFDFISLLLTINLLYLFVTRHTVKSIVIL